MVSLAWPPCHSPLQSSRQSADGLSFSAQTGRLPVVSPVSWLLSRERGPRTSCPNSNWKGLYPEAL